MKWPFSTISKSESSGASSDVKKIEAVSGSEIGVPGLTQYSGYVREEFLKELQGSRGMKVYREMRYNSAVIGAMLFAIEMMVRQTPWRVDPVDAKQTADVDASLFIEDCRTSMEHTWTEFIVEVLSMLPFGWALFEEVYQQREDGFYGWKRFGLRAQETLLRWMFDDETGDLLGMVQLAPPKFHTIEIPIERCILFRTTTHKGNPEGQSMLRNAYRSWYFAKRIEEIEGIGIERDLAGLPMATVPAKIMDANAAVSDRSNFEYIKKMVRRVRRDEQEGLVMPSDRDDKGNLLYDFKLLSTGGTRQFNTNDIITRYDQRILMTLIADFIMLGTASKTGSFALSSDKTDLFAVAIGAILDNICETFNRYAIARLLAINGMEGQCKLCHGDIEKVDLTVLGTFIRNLVAAGAPLFPDDNLENWLREQGNMPPREVDSGDLTTDEGLEAGAGTTDTATTTGSPTGLNAEGNVQQAALNGAQVTAMLEVLTAVATGQLPRDSGIQTLVSAFPLTLEQAERIMSTLGNGFVPTPDAPEKPAFGAPNK